MADRCVVAVGGLLLDVLAAHFASWSRNTLKQRLALGCVQVNGATVRRHDHALQAGDKVEILAKAVGEVARASAPSLATLLLDDDLVAIDKPEGLLSVAADDERQPTAMAIVRESLSRPGQSALLWPVHRLDRETSGVLLFARSREVCDLVQGDWASVEKTYLAIVEGQLAPSAGVIEAPLWEDRNLRVRVGDHEDARPARTRYKTLQTSRSRALLEVGLDTGRKHQIRAHLAHLGHPVVGDQRYGVRDARLGLHSLRLALAHPRDRRALVIEAPPPAAFLALLGS